MAIKVQKSKLHKLGTIGDGSLQAQQPGSNATACSTVAWPGLAQNRHSLRSRHRASWTQPSPATVMDTMATSSRSPVSVIVPPRSILQTIWARPAFQQYPLTLAKTKSYFTTPWKIVTLANTLKAFRKTTIATHSCEKDSKDLIKSLVP